MRRCYVQIDGVLYERGTEPTPTGLLIVPDIKPYRSMIDGSEIASRSKHREHLRIHGYEEVGNEVQALMKTAPRKDEGRKELIRAQIDAMSQAEFKRAVARDIERVKWNSRKE